MNYSDIERQTFKTFLAFSTLLLTFIVIFFNLSSTVYRVSNISYIENEDLDYSSIERLVGVSIWLVDYYYFQDFYDDNPTVDSLSITKELPDTLIANIILSDQIANIEDKRQVPSSISVLYKNLYLERGKNYYTGTILEVISSSTNLGSLVGGGRYDQLTEKFSVKDISGVGISFGLDRLYLALTDANLFPNHFGRGVEYLFLNFGKEEVRLAYSYMMKLRALNISCELYPESVKINKQMNYADKRGTSFVIMIGEEEMQKNKITVKNMTNGEQKFLSFKELIKSL